MRFLDWLREEPPGFSSWGYRVPRWQRLLLLLAGVAIIVAVGAFLAWLGFSGSSNCDINNLKGC